MFGVIKNADASQPCHVLHMTSDGYGVMTAKCNCGLWEYNDGDNFCQNDIMQVNRKYRQHLASLRSKPEKPTATDGSGSTN